ncbi:MAG: 2,3-bisphosphoglycerate-independent phosphoglycerate mutase, partial [Schleiferiaceae bacterium]|nr:2,3-bisphosphoglycerate-independent phosphoglycerate mutase [Schleiferiaceae bacterium]
TVLFDKDKVQECMGQVLADAGLRQIRIAETEKYPHVTYFFNGGHEAEFEGEQRILIPSPKVATYDLQPEMSAYEIRDAIIPLLTDDGPDFICLNFANPDMVGHTGNMDAAVQAVETVDACAEAVVQAGLSNGYTFFILADHGNCDCMINPDGSPNTAHSTQPVPFHLVSALDCSSINMGDGALSDVAPTILEWMGVTQPEQMTGQSLIQHF